MWYRINIPRNSSLTIDKLDELDVIFYQCFDFNGGSIDICCTEETLTFLAIKHSISIQPLRYKLYRSTPPW